MTRGTSKNRDFALRTGAAKDRLVDRLAIADAAYLYAAAVDILGNNPFIEGKKIALSSKRRRRSNNA
jgi:hypothetical protein